MLGEVTFIKGVEEEHLAKNEMQEPETPYQRIKRIQAEIGDKELFRDIKDPSEWQREIRREWYRDSAHSINI